MGQNIDAVTAYRETLQATVDVLRDMLITPEVMIAAINASSRIAMLQTTEGREGNATNIRWRSWNGKPTCEEMSAAEWSE